MKCSNSCISKNSPRFHFAVIFFKINIIFLSKQIASSFLHFLHERDAIIRNNDRCIYCYSFLRIVFTFSCCCYNFFIFLYISFLHCFVIRLLFIRSLHQCITLCLCKITKGQTKEYFPFAIMFYFWYFVVACWVIFLTTYTLKLV